jgi:hypothetical protein
MDDRYLAQARLPSNSGYKSVQLRLREVEVRSDDSILLVEVAVKGEMFERGKTRTGGLVTDFEWAFPQLRVSLRDWRTCRRSCIKLEPANRRYVV